MLESVRRRGAASTLGALIECQGRWLLPAILAVATLVSLLPTLWNGFVWDDDANFVRNPYYRGLGWPQFRWMLTTFHLGHYIPLTWLTLGLDYVLWGMSPIGYHLTTLVLHIVNALVFYVVAVRLLAAARPAGGDDVATGLGGAVAALLFATHPLRVESVAWATERRDVLCGLFYLLAILAYLRACDGSSSEGLWRRRWYWGAVVLAGLALLSKSMAVSLPVVLLVLDVYPLRRLGGGWKGWVGPAARRVWAEKVPFVVLSEAASVVALAALYPMNGIRPIAQLGLADRVAISAYSLVFYLWKTVLPVHLSPMYELPERIEPLGWPYVVAGLAAATASASAVLRRRRWPGFAAAWVSYVVILLPVVGIVQNGWQIAADRYTYLATLGWAVLAGAGVSAWYAAGPSRSARTRRAVTVVGIAVAVTAALGALTWHQTLVWHDAKTLWTRAVETYPSVTAHYNLAVVLGRQGQVSDAITQYRLALAMKPDFAEAHNNLGVALAELGQVDEAVQQFREALKAKPDYADAHYGLGLALMRQGRQDEAAEQFRRALLIRPNFQEARRDLDRALAVSGLSR